MSTCTRPLEDNEHGARCGDEGLLCDFCFAAEMADHVHLRDVSRHQIFNDQQAIDERNRELRDAGRAHLVGDIE